MKPTKNTRTWLLTGLFVLLSVNALPSKADPTGGWVTYRTSFYGYGGDYLDMARYNFDYRFWTIDKQFPIAVAKTYIVKSKSGIGNPIVINSVDQVHEFFGYETNMGLPIVARAIIDDGPALQSDSNYRSQKGWAVFMAAQAMFVCSDGSTIPGPVAVKGGSTPTATNTADSYFESYPLCAGSPPVYISAVYAHGIGPQ